MKSKELIRLLQELDPTGELEVSVGKTDIFYIIKNASFWDGTLQVLQREESKKPYYNVIGARYKSTGQHLSIVPLSISEAIWENPDLPVDYSEGNCKVYRATDDITRQESKDATFKWQIELFTEWVKDKVDNIRPGENCKEDAEQFYRQNLSPADPVKNIPNSNERQRLEATWNDTVEVIWDGFGLTIRRKGDRLNK